MRVGLWLAALLVLTIAGASAMLRLSQAGVGCTPWPACYAARDAWSESAAAKPDTQAAAAVPAWQHDVRLVHRVSASLAGIVFLFLTVLGWGRWNLGERVAGLLLIGLAAGLALLGRVTPSPLPIVVLANLLGGHLLLATLAWLLAAPGAAAGLAAAQDAGAAPGSRPAAVVALVVLVLLQAALGGLVSARAAAAACDAGCGVEAITQTTAAAFDPLQTNAALASTAPAAPERRALLQAHTLGSVAVLAAALWVGWLCRRRARAASALLLASVVAGATLGWAMRLQPLPLTVAVVHSLLAALVLAAAVAIWHRTRPV